MATKAMGPVIIAALAANATVTALLGSRVCVEGGTLEDEALPFATYQVNSNRADRDLDGIADGYDADVSVTFTAETYAEIAELLEAAAVALQGMTGSVGGVTISGSNVDDVSDQPNGPIDVDEGQIFQGDLTVSIAYQ